MLLKKNAYLCTRQISYWLMVVPIHIDEHAAFERCFRDNYQALCYFAASILGDEVAAEDVVQDAFVRLYKSDHTFPSHNHLRNYLYTAVHNLAIDRLRHSQRAVAVPVDHVGHLMSDDTEAIVVRTELLRQIAEAISQLSERQRDVFRLAYIEDKSNAEIAELLGDVYPLLLFMIYST